MQHATKRTPEYILIKDDIAFRKIVSPGVVIVIGHSQSFIVENVTADRTPKAHFADAISEMPSIVCGCPVRQERETNGFEILVPVGYCTEKDPIKAGRAIEGRERPENLQLPLSGAETGSDRNCRHIPDLALENVGLRRDDQHSEKQQKDSSFHDFESIMARGSKVVL